MRSHRPQVPRKKWPNDEHHRSSCCQVLRVELLPCNAPHHALICKSTMLLMLSAPLHCVADLMTCLRPVDHQKAFGIWKASTSSSR